MKPRVAILFALFLFSCVSHARPAGATRFTGEHGSIEAQLGFCQAVGCQLPARLLRDTERSAGDSRAASPENRDQCVANPRPVNAQVAPLTGRPCIDRCARIAGECGTGRVIPDGDQDSVGPAAAGGGYLHGRNNCGSRSGARRLLGEPNTRRAEAGAPGWSAVHGNDRNGSAASGSGGDRRHARLVAIHESLRVHARHGSIAAGPHHSAVDPIANVV